jgi:hypothetical protein
LTNYHQSAKKDKLTMLIRGRRTSILMTISLFSLMMVFSGGPLSAARLIFAQTATASNNKDIGSSSSINTMANMVLNLGAPLFIENSKTTSMTNITQDITNGTFEGNGTFVLPNGRNVSTVDTGYRLINSEDGLIRAGGHVFLKTLDGKESATIDFARFTPVNSTLGVGIAYMKTNSPTGAIGQQQLASLNNTLMVYKSELLSQAQGIATYWKWE